MPEPKTGPDYSHSRDTAPVTRADLRLHIAEAKLEKMERKEREARDDIQEARKAKRLGDAIAEGIRGDVVTTGVTNGGTTGQFPPTDIAPCP